MNITKEYIQRAIDELGFKKWTEVQEKVIPKAIKKQDIIGCSQTGTGKTHAFLIPVFEGLNEEQKEVQVVILTPTRELALQIYKVASQIASHYDGHIDIRKFVGGSDRDSEITKLEKSQPQIVIGTPGKVSDLALKSNVLKIYTAKTFILDEADMALDTGFLDDIFKIVDLLDEQKQMMVFSATIPEEIRPFLRKYLKTPYEVFIKPRELSSLNIKHIFLPVKSKDKITVLNQLLKIINPYICLIFANKKEQVDQLASLLYNNGKKVAKLHGDISPRERKRILQNASKAMYQYIVCSDIAARGIDIDGVSDVINFDLPNNMEFYIHRTGRTGRASYQGNAFTLYTVNDDAYIDFLEEKNIHIVYNDIKNGELVEKRVRKERQKRKKVTAGFDKHSVNVKKNNKKVKPGYKKKYHNELQRQKKKALRRGQK